LFKTDYSKQKHFCGFPRFLQARELARTACVQRFVFVLRESRAGESRNVFCTVEMSLGKGKTESIRKRFKLPCAIQCGVQNGIDVQTDPVFRLRKSESALQVFSCISCR